MNQPNITNVQTGLESQSDSPFSNHSEISLENNSIARLVDQPPQAKNFKFPTFLASGNWKIELGAMAVVCLLALSCSLIAKEKVDQLTAEKEQLQLRVHNAESSLGEAQNALTANFKTVRELRQQLALSIENSKNSDALIGPVPADGLQSADEASVRVAGQFNGANVELNKASGERWPGDHNYRVRYHAVAPALLHMPTYTGNTHVDGAFEGPWHNSSGK